MHLQDKSQVECRPVLYTLKKIGNVLYGANFSQHLQYSLHNDNKTSENFLTECSIAMQHRLKNAQQSSKSGHYLE